MSDLALKSPDLDLNRDKIELIKQTVAKGATDLELELFFHACKRTGLDPLMKQIYAIKRWNNVEKRETLTFQTGIDGYRLIADRTGCYAGSSDAEFELDGNGNPILARVTVTKFVQGQPCQFTASARWEEYVQRTREGAPTAMWARMRFLMLQKCAEALALRKAFPAELSGVYTHEEMSQADEAKPEPQAKYYRENKEKVAQAFQEIREDIKEIVAEPEPVLFNPEVCPPADEQPKLTAANVCQQFRLAESTDELSSIMNEWQVEARKHPQEERMEVNKVFGEQKRRLAGRR